VLLWGFFVSEAPTDIMIAEVSDGILVLVQRDLKRFDIPVRVIGALATATDAQLADVRIGPSRDSIHWPGLDVTMDVPRFLAALGVTG
jgi:hypothetical protein